MCRDVLQAIRDLVRFRREIRTAMIALNPALETAARFLEPSRGHIECSGKTWSFKKHGAGYRFEAPRLVVEWCEWHVPPTVFSLFELDDLLQSQGRHPNPCANSGAALVERRTHVAHLERCLGNLVAAGVVDRSDKHYLYHASTTEKAN